MAVCIADYEKVLHTKQGEKSLLEKQLTSASDEIESLKKRIPFVEEAQLIIQKVAMATQQQIVFRIEDIVNKVLQSTFPDYSFELAYEVSRGRSVAVLNFFCGGEPINIMEDSGGAVDLATMGLRFALWSLSKKHDVMILDEHLKYVSEDLQQRASEVLLEICHALNIQVIMISHIPAIKQQADSLIELRKQGKYSVIT